MIAQQACYAIADRHEPGMMRCAWFGLFWGASEESQCPSVTNGEPSPTGEAVRYGARLRESSEMHTGDV